MAQITAAMVKELRETTSAGMMDCKKALTETDGDMAAAVDWLRTKGLSKAAKKAGRVAAEGLVSIAVDGKTGAAVELNSETDFVSRNDEFQAFARELAELAIGVNGDVEALKTAKMTSGENVADGLNQLIATIGENMNLRRTESISVNEGVVASYIHNASGENLGKIGVLVGVESAGDADKLAEIGHKVAMHIAAVAPLSLSMDDLDPAAVAKEKEILSEQARESGKPEAIIEKMVMGRINKFYSEVVLMKQSFVMDPDLSVEKFVEAQAKELGVPVTISAFVRMNLGEGLEKKEEDFAAEVAAASKG